MAAFLASSSLRNRVLSRLSVFTLWVRTKTECPTVRWHAAQFLARCSHSAQRPCLAGADIDVSTIAAGTPGRRWNK